MPEDDEDRLSDTESWPSDSTPSVDLSPLPPSPILTATTFNDNFSEIFSCMSLQTKPSGASIQSGSVEARRLSRGSALSLLATGMSQFDEEEAKLEPKPERPHSPMRVKDPTAETDESDSEPEVGDNLDMSGSFVEILSPGLDLGTPHSFGSKTGSIEDIGSAENINVPRLSLKIYEGEEYGENCEYGGEYGGDYGRRDYRGEYSGEYGGVYINQVMSVPEIQEENIEVEFPSSSAENLELEMTIETPCTQTQKSSKYSPMAFGLDPNKGSLLW